MSNRYVIFCLIFFFVFIAKPLEAKKLLKQTINAYQLAKSNTDDVLVPEQTSEEEVSVRAAGEIPTEVFSFRGVEDLTAPVIIELKNGEVDISSVIQSINRIKESDYDNFSDANNALREVFPRVRRKITQLCRQSENKKHCRSSSVSALNDFRNSIRKYIRYIYTTGRSTKRLLSFLDSDCNDCSNKEITEAIMQGPQEQYSQLYNKIKSKDNNCKQDILKSLAKQFTVNRFTKRCLKKENKNRQGCKNLFKDVEVVKNRFAELVELVYGEKITETTEAKDVCLECLFESGDKMTEAIDELFTTLNERSQCLEFKPEEKRIVRPGTGLSVKPYRVKRELDGSYSAFLVFEFMPDKDYDNAGLVSREDVSDYYMQKVQACMAKANQKMLGPNGEKLRIVINKPSKKDSCFKQRILVGSKDYGTDDLKYASDIIDDCPAITHEVLHRFGLCDEYQEIFRGFIVNPRTGKIKKYVDSIADVPVDKRDFFRSAWDCRVTQKNSIMADHQKRWEFVFGKDGSQAKQNNFSLIHPAHFNAIVYGNCVEKNKIFNECSRLAFVNSFENESCLQKKQHCESQNILGRSEEEILEMEKQEQKRIEEIKQMGRRNKRKRENAREKEKQEPIDE